MSVELLGQTLYLAHSVFTVLAAMPGQSTCQARALSSQCFFWGSCATASTLMLSPRLVPSRYEAAHLVGRWSAGPAQVPSHTRAATVSMRLLPVWAQGLVSRALLRFLSFTSTLSEVRALNARHCCTGTGIVCVETCLTIL